MSMLIRLDMRKNKFQSQRDTILNCFEFFSQLDTILDIGQTIKQLDEVSQELENIILFMLKKKQLIETGKKIDFTINIDNQERQKIQFQIDQLDQQQKLNKNQLINAIDIRPVDRQEQSDQVVMVKKFKVYKNKDRLEYLKQNEMWRDFYSVINNEYYCSKCDRNFNTVQKIFRHSVESHQQQKFKCQKCKQFYYSQIQVYLHVKYEHNKELKDLDFYQCDICNKTVQNHFSLRSHVEFLHLKEIWSDFQDFRQDYQQFLKGYFFKMQSFNVLLNCRDSRYLRTEFTDSITQTLFR